MKIRLLTALSGSTGAWVAGDVVECDKEQAKRYVDSGIGEYLKKTTKKVTKK